MYYDFAVMWDWLSLGVRWLHVITGIAWIGSSFYFIALDLGLRKADDLPPGAHGEEWQVHGGGFYHIRKYLVAPEAMPDHLTWFKWGSYVTWLSGFALLAIVYYAGADLFLIDRQVADLSNWQAIAITSANSVRALAQRKDLTRLNSIPVLAVGPSSARAATLAGFTTVHSADGDLEALIKLAAQHLSASEGPVLYPSGVTISGDLKAQLESRGYDCVRVPLYEAVATAEVSAELIHAIQQNEMDGVVLFSPRTARIWAKCLGNAGLVQSASRMTHWCLSNAVAEALLDEFPSWRPAQNVVTAPVPNENSLLGP